MRLKEILDNIKERWIADNNFEAIIGLDNAPRYAPTGSEGLGLICKYINDLKINNSTAYESIHDLAEDLEAYAKQSAKNIR